jgi:chaperonin GroES
MANNKQDTLIRYLSMDNIAEEFKDERLNSIGQRVVQEYKMDDDSMADWKKNIENALKIAKQTVEAKNTPFPNASNVFFPLMTIACTQFNARTYPAIVKGPNIVKGYVEGDDPTGVKEIIAHNISLHMSYQLMEEIENWEEEMDRLTMALPFYGMVYKKIYYDYGLKRPVIDFVKPTDVIVNTNIKCLSDARRITQIIVLYDNDIMSRINEGCFLDIPLKDFSEEAFIKNDDGTYKEVDNFIDSDKPHYFLEQHRFLDLDNDGYKEPYIVTVHIATERVVRIVANYTKDSIVKNPKNNKIIEIKPVAHFVDYHFIPSMDGTYHSLGFSHLLYALNQAVNTNLNQLIDSGTLANTQTALMAKGTRTQKGVYKIKQGVIMEVETPLGMSLRDSLIPLPFKEPSNVLFQLVNMLIDAGRQISLVSDVLQGDQPAQNVPATTILALIEQSEKPFSTIAKRIDRSFNTELKILFNINKEYLGKVSTPYEKVNQITRNDYKVANVGVIPVADPSLSSDAMRLAKAQAEMQLYGKPEINNFDILKGYLEAIEASNINKKLIPPNPNAPPPPDVQKIMADISLIEMQKADIMMARELEAVKLELQQKQLYINATQVGAQAAQMKLASVLNMAQFELEAGTALSKETRAQFQHELEMVSTTLDLASKQTAALATAPTPTPIEQTTAEAPIPIQQRLAASVGSPPDSAAPSEANQGPPSSVPASMNEGSTPEEAPPSEPASIEPAPDSQIRGIGGGQKPSPQRFERES